MEHGICVRHACALAIGTFFWTLDPRAVGGAAEPAPDRDSQKPLLWAADAEGGAPYISMDPEHPGQYIGFEVDLIKALEKEVGRPIQFKQFNFTNLASALNRGDIDFAMNGMERTPDREALFRLSRPYYVFTLQLVVRRNETRINSLEDCKKPGIRVGTLGDTAASRLLPQTGVPYRTYDSQTTPYKDLEQNQLDTVLLDLPIAMQYTQRDPQFNEKLKFAGKPLSPGFYVIVFRKENEQLAARFDAAIDRLRGNGTLKKIYRAWGLWNDDQAALENGQLEETIHTAATTWTFAQFFPRLLGGAAMTVVLTFLGFLLAMAIGLPVATARLYGSAPLRWLATVYVEFFRGIPVLLLLYFLYYSLPEVGGMLGLPANLLKLNAFLVGVIGFGLNYGAYESEIYRAGISSIPVGQWEAGASLGMTPLRIFRRIILPQAVKVILPPMTNDFVALFKDTSVVSVIAVEELMKTYQIMASDHLQYVEIGVTTIVLYLLMSVPLAQLSRYLEHRWGKGR
jgi:polar amino acid transport system substrate-binding protein